MLLFGIAIGGGVATDGKAARCWLTRERCAAFRTSSVFSIQDIFESKFIGALATLAREIPERHNVHHNPSNRRVLTKEMVAPTGFEPIQTLSESAVLTVRRQGIV